MAMTAKAMKLKLEVGKSNIKTMKEHCTTFAHIIER